MGADGLLLRAAGAESALKSETNVTYKYTCSVTHTASSPR